MEFALLFLIWTLIAMLSVCGSIAFLGLISLLNAKTKYLDAQRKMIES